MGKSGGAGRRWAAIAGLALACTSAAAEAAIRTWTLQNVTFDDGAIATGSFSYDDTINVVTSWNISVSPGTNPTFFPFTFMPGNSLAGAVPGPLPPVIVFGAPNAGPPLVRRDFRIRPGAVLDGSPDVVPLDLSNPAYNVECMNCLPFRFINGGSLALATLPPPVGIVTVVEFHHAALDHYFITAIPAEIAALDGGAQPGWVRTGESFKAFAIGSGGGGATASPVCRFFAPGPSTHFYSAISSECRDVALGLTAVWQIESGNVFQVELPDTTSGACPAGSVPIYRVYNNRPDPNHRYTTSTSIRASMEAQGWTREGFGPDAVIMCGRP
jgi:hypothetical protein